MSGLALVTGGAGFIGSHLVEGLLAAGMRVRVLDDFSTGREENLAAAAGRVEVVRGDCCRAEEAQAAVSGAELVFHEAALPSVQRSVEDPFLAQRRNLDATLVMLDAARRAGVRRFIYAGSSSVYGDSAELPRHEGLCPEPLSPYAAQKLAAEHYCRVFAGCYGLHTVVLRYFNVYGPRQDPSSPYSGVISLFIAALLDGRAPFIFGDGRQTRDFVFVGDVVAANLLAATRDLPRGSIVNVASGRRSTVLELFDTVQRAVGGGALGIEPLFAAARPGDVRDSLADLTRARDLLGFQPTVSLGEGVRHTVVGFLNATQQKEKLP
ncbi:MAG: SDR family oxidoreductase [Planctomycetes bacterium]|nr:SDR family oxidoreductase [Planctomycetota bacterium]